MRLVTLLLVFLAAPTWSNPASRTDPTPWDGRLYDLGTGRTAPAQGAPEALGRLSYLRGDWSVVFERSVPDSEPRVSRGHARITWMNRGHALLERVRFAGDERGLDGRRAGLAFWAVDAEGAWTRSEANDWHEAIEVFSGAYDGDRLQLHDARRPGGGKRLAWLRRTLERDSNDAWRLRYESSSDAGETWALAAVARYTRREEDSDFPVRDDTGQAAPDRPPEAGQFDFLIGEFEAEHWLKLPTGPVRFRANATATWVLDGHAILEHGWHDHDPTLPDAATTILRLYNRAMRRWESLFLSNRNNVPLHFGGVREGENMVLHPFAARASAPALFRWIFYDVQEDSYRWKGLRSNDRGATWAPTWTIDFQRRDVADREAPSVSSLPSPKSARSGT